MCPRISAAKLLDAPPQRVVFARGRLPSGVFRYPVGVCKNDANAASERGELQMSNLIHFLASALGRFHVVLGMALLRDGVLATAGTPGPILAVVGLVPIGLGVWGHCLLEAVAPKTARTA
jgi:hypothetical protein